MHIMLINKEVVEMEDVLNYSELIIIHKGNVTARGKDKLHAKMLWTSLSILRIKLIDIKDIDLFYRFTLALTSIEHDLLRQIGGYLKYD